jgi:hypothetical protein
MCLQRLWSICLLPVVVVVRVQTEELRGVVAVLVV